MSDLKIVHFSSTPLVDSPGKISLTQRMQGDDSICFMASDYPKNSPLYKFFSNNTILICKENLDFFKYKINCADIIHIHNYIEKKWLDLIVSLNTSAKLIYQVHSPLREGPLYYPREFDTVFDVHLTVAQHWSRFYPGYIPVPNLILEPPSIRERAKGEKLKVLFSPTHKHSGRWTDKHTPGLEELLSLMHKSKLIDFYKPPKAIPPIELNMIRKNSDITIDEIQTGGFHMVSLEGLAFGNIVVNNADYFAKETYRSVSGEVPPFHRNDIDTIYSFLVGLSGDIELTNKLKIESVSYFKNYCNPMQLIKVFNRVYEK